MVGGYWELQAAAGILATAASRVGLRGHLGIGDSRSLRSVRMYLIPSSRTCWIRPLVQCLFDTETKSKLGKVGKTK